MSEELSTFCHCGWHRLCVREIDLKTSSDVENVERKSLLSCSIDNLNVDGAKPFLKRNEVLGWLNKMRFGWGGANKALFVSVEASYVNKAVAALRGPAIHQKLLCFDTWERLLLSANRLDKESFFTINFPSAFVGFFLFSHRHRPNSKAQGRWMFVALTLNCKWN